MISITLALQHLTEFKWLLELNFNNLIFKKYDFTRIFWIKENFDSWGGCLSFYSPFLVVCHDISATGPHFLLYGLVRMDNAVIFSVSGSHLIIFGAWADRVAKWLDLLSFPLVIELEGKRSNRLDRSDWDFNRSLISKLNGWIGLNRKV